MDSFAFKESTDKNVLKYIGVAVLIFLIIIGSVVFSVNNLVALSYVIYLLAATVFFLFFYVFIKILKNNVVATNIYELSSEEICRKNTKTNNTVKFRLDEIESIENDFFTYKNTEREYIRIRFRNSLEYFTIQSDPYDVKVALDFSRFKVLFFEYMKDYKTEARPQQKTSGVFSNFLFWMSLSLIFVLVTITVLVFATGKAHKLAGLIPLYIGFISIIIAGLMRWRKRKN